MKKFKYPLAIEGIKTQLERLVPKLEELGYKLSTDYSWNRCPYLYTNFGNTPSVMGPNQTPHFNTVVSADNEELVLALAAMVDDNILYDGEYLWSIIGNEVAKSDGTMNYRSFNPQSKNPITIYRKATKAEIINHFIMKEKKIIGYKLKEGVNKEIFKSLLHVPKMSFDRLEVDAGSFSILIDEMRELKVLDLWFDPVYEPEKPKKEIITLRCEGGSFEIEVSKEGIYYAADGTTLDVGDLKNAIANRVISHNKNSRYSFTPTFIDSGCKKNVPVEDWRKVLEAYNRLRDKLYA